MVLERLRSLRDVHNQNPAQATPWVIEAIDRISDLFRPKRNLPKLTRLLVNRLAVVLLIVFDQFGVSPSPAVIHQVMSANARHPRPKRRERYDMGVKPFDDGKMPVAKLWERVKISFPENYSQETFASIVYRRRKEWFPDLKRKVVHKSKQSYSQKNTTARRRTPRERFGGQ